MPSIFRVWITDYVDAEGHRVKPGTPGATKRKRKSSKWYGRGIPGEPPTKRVPLATDKAAAKRMLDEMIRDSERGTLRMPSAKAGKVTLAESLDKFADDLRRGLATRNRRRKPSDGQASLTVQRVRDCLEGCKFVMPSDLGDDAAGKLTDYLTGRCELARTDGGISAQSAAFFLAAMKRFAWWLAVRQRAPVRAEVFDAVRVADPKTNRVHARRPATPAEVEKLLATVKASKRVYRGLSGVDRFHLWTLAFSTGLRSGELAILTPAHFKLDAEPPVVALGAKETKGDKAARQPLPSPVAAMFRDYIQGKPPKSRVWSGTWPGTAAKMLRRDLKEAGIPYAVDSSDGKLYLDAHSIRHTYVTTLAAAGVGVKELQTLARHANAETTLNVYTHASAAAVTESIARLVVPGVTGQAVTLADLPRQHLEALAAVALTLADFLLSPFARPLALTDGINGHKTGQSGTKSKDSPNGKNRSKA